jgi:hypothetical protein
MGSSSQFVGLLTSHHFLAFTPKMYKVGPRACLKRFILLGGQILLSYNECFSNRLVLRVWKKNINY